MLKNYFLIALRTFFRQPGYTLINIFGLAVGIACCVLVMRYVDREFAFEQHHPHVDRTYRMLREMRVNGDTRKVSPGIDGALSARIAEVVPEVEKAVRLYARVCWMRSGDQLFERKFVQAEDGFLDLFSYTLKMGDFENLRRVANGILITEDTAKMFFADENPIGKVISSNYSYIEGDYVVVGVVENINRTALSFDILTTTEHQGSRMQSVWSKWRPGSGSSPVHAFLLLKDGADVLAVESKIADILKVHYDADYVSKNQIHLQRLDRIRLHSYVDYKVHSGGDITRVYTMSACGLFLLLVACINYVNLATARSASRALEIGLRKVVGANRSQLVGQFIGESVLMSVLAAILGLLLSEVADPYLVAFIGWSLLTNPSIWSLLFIVVPCAILLGIFAGCYPAFFLSRYQPAVVVKGHTAMSSNGAMRKGLVVFQFVLSVVVISGVLVVKDQVDFLRNKNLGFDSEEVIVTRLFRNAELRQRWPEVKARFLQHPNIVATSATSTHPGIWVEYWRMRPEGKEPWRVYALGIDEDFLDLYDVQLLEGMNVSANDPTEGSYQYLLNESAVRALGWQGEAIGKRLAWEGVADSKSGTVVGVVADFHARNLYAKIPPLILCKNPQSFRSCSFKIRGENVEQTIAFMKETWQNLQPEVPFEFGFLDEMLDNRYRGDEKTGQIFQFLAVLAIMVACLGLVGLSTYTIQQRAKEIGIRKVLGASVSRITVMLLSEVLVLVGVANVIAWPLAYYGMNSWLAKFAYRIDVGIEAFVMGGLFVLLIALMAVGRQTFKAAVANPIDALRRE